MRNDTVSQIQDLLHKLERDYNPSEQERINFEYAYRLNVAFAKALALDDGKNFNELAPTSQSTYLRMARAYAGIDHDEFLTHIRDGRFSDQAEAILEELE